MGLCSLQVSKIATNQLNGIQLLRCDLVDPGSAECVRVVPIGTSINTKHAYAQAHTLSIHKVIPDCLEY